MATAEGIIEGVKFGLSEGQRVGFSEGCKLGCILGVLLGAADAEPVGLIVEGRLVGSI